MYSAVSIIESLKSSALLECEGLDCIQCPNTLPEIDCTGGAECEKGREQNCKQRIKIFRDYKLLLILTIRFKVSPERSEGFVRKNDSDIEKLFVRNFIDKKTLKTA
jgi:hypothetical protein